MNCQTQNAVSRTLTQRSARRRGVLLSVAMAGTLAAFAVAQDSSAPSSAAAVQPDKAKAYYHYSLGHLLAERGALYNRADLLSEAIDEMELALQYDPSSTYLSMELADLYANTNRWQSELQEVEDNARRNPNDPAARRLLGRLYVRLLSGEREIGRAHV